MILMAQPRKGVGFESQPLQPSPIIKAGSGDKSDLNADIKTPDNNRAFFYVQAGSDRCYQNSANPVKPEIKHRRF